MSPLPDKIPPPSPTAARPLPPTLAFEPMPEASGVMQILEALLRRPGRIVHAVEARNLRVLGFLALIAVGCLLGFGLLVGSFSGGEQWIAAPLKIVVGAFLSAIICLPSLYIFSCLGGASLRLQSACGIVLVMLALTAVLLVAFGPIMWLFTQATNSIGFIGFLGLAFWFIGLSFGFRFVLTAASHFGLENRGTLMLWCGLFLIVTFQMSTAIRPIVGTADTVLPGEKRFFVEHWFATGGR